MDLSRTDPSKLAGVAILIVGVYLAWGFLSGRRGRVPLYVVTLVVCASLVGGAAAKLLGARGLAEIFSVTWFALSWAALTSPPRLWELQLKDDWERSRLYQPLRPRDFLTWQGWLKLVDRIGARKATGAYVGALVVGMACQLFVWDATDPFFVLALAGPMLFAGLSGTWINRAVRRVMPGA